MIRLWAVAALAGLAVLPGCVEGAPSSLDFGIGASNRSPVVVSLLEVDGVNAVSPDTVSSSGADSFPRQDGSTTLSGPRGDSFTLRVEWTEILTGNSYLGVAEIGTADLAVDNKVGDLVVLLLAGGIMVVGSDPVPKTTQVETRDIARICAQRQPSKDRILARAVDGRFKATPDAPVLVDRALEFVKSPLIAAPCKQAGQADR